MGQKIELHESYEMAKEAAEKLSKSGWLVHAMSATQVRGGYPQIMVVYRKEG